MIQIKSPNYSSREENKVLACVVHVADGSREAVRQTFLNPASKVSSHYLVCQNGDVIQFVSEDMAAWANGLKVRPTAKVVLDNPSINPNFFTVSIENEGWGNKDISDLMYQKNAELVKEICLRHGLSIDSDTVIGHRQIRADKICPGKIDIERIIRMTGYPPSHRTETSPNSYWEHLSREYKLDYLQTLINNLKEQIYKLLKLKK